MRTVNLLKQIYVLLLLVYFTPLTLAKDNPNNSEYKDNIKIIEEKVNGYLKSWYPEYNKKDNYKKFEMIEDLPANNEQKYEILMLTIRFDNLKKSDEQLRFGQSEFFTDRTQNEGDIVCINSNKKIGIVLIKTWFLGRGTNGFEFDSSNYLAELGEDLFDDRFNFILLKKKKFPKYENGNCLK